MNIYPDHGGDIYGNARIKTDFSANLNPLGTPDEIKEALKDSLKDITAYPDPELRKLRDKASDAIGVDKQFLVFGNGSSDLIYRLAATLKPEKVLIEGPAFSEYEKAFRFSGAEVYYTLSTRKENFRPDTDRIEGDLRKFKPDLLIAGSPSNPAGTLMANDQIEKILSMTSESDTLFLMDTCFLHFVEEKDRPDIRSLLKRYKNFLVIDSFTKIYAMAGIRFGYLMSSDCDLVLRLRKSTQPWPLSTPANAAALAGFDIMSDGYFHRKSSTYIKEEREYLMRSLEEMGLEVFPSRANYLLFYAEGNPALGDLIKAEGYPIRECANYEGLDGQYYRIAVRTASENRALIKALNQILGLKK